jgi:CRP/FNR family transcriptional regulator, cyclic AMP receptor protein
MIQTLEVILAKHPLFEGLEQKYLEIIVGCAKNVRFKEGEFILREGKQADTFYLVREGRIAVDIYAPNVGAITIHTIQPGEVLGWSWLMSPYRWHFDAQALEPIRAIALDGKCIRNKCEENKDLGYELMKRFSQVIVQRLQATQMQLLDVYNAHQ